MDTHSIQNFGFKRVRHPTQIIYSSAIAHQMAAQSSESADAAAKAVAKYWRIYCQQLAPPEPSENLLRIPLPGAALQSVTVQVTATNLVQIVVGDRALAAGLDWLIYTAELGRASVESTFTVQTLEPCPFVIQHAHARCCSLLRLAQETGRISLEVVENEWRITAPFPIAWLTPDGQLRLHQPSDRQLISQIFLALDEWLNADPTLRDRQRVAEQVTQAFLTFHADRPGFGPPSPEQPAYWGLVLATQRVLFWLLTCSGWAAPVEL